MEGNQVQPVLNPTTGFFEMTTLPKQHIKQEEFSFCATSASSNGTSVSADDEAIGTDGRGLGEDMDAEADDDINYMFDEDDSSGSGSYRLAKSTTTPRAPSASTTSTVTKVRRKPVPRKGHTKSRKGCLNCKRRRVKCPETLPECDSCRRLGLLCQYPKNTPGGPGSRGGPGATSSSAAAAIVAAAAASATARAGEAGPLAMSLSASPTFFSIEDMRFFQHFLCTAYPPLPINGEDVWKEVAALSHSYEYLLHAMLALGASHLTLCSAETDFSSHALAHRVQSITSLNSALCRPCTSKAEGDARFATVMALTFQSAYMPEGMMEFLSMVRGCIVISDTAMPAFEQSAFRTFSTTGHQQSVRVLNGVHAQDHGQSPLDDGGFAEQGLESLRAVGRLCHSAFEVKYLAILVAVLERAKVSYVDSFTELCGAYYVFEQPNHEEFSSFIDPSNHVAQILVAHFFLIEYIVGAQALKPILEAFPFRGIIAATWIRGVAANLPTDYEPYIRWALEYSKSINGPAPVRPKRPLGT